MKLSEIKTYYINLDKDEEKKEFVLDSKKLDVNVVKTDKGTEITVAAETSALKRVGTWLAKFYAKKFNKKK